MKNKEMYLICEEAVDTQFTLRETKPSGEVVIEAKLQDFFKRNRNGRIYGEALKAALRTSELMELMNAKSWFGEAGHPADKELTRQVTIDPTLISHEIRSIWIDGDTLYAYIHTIPGRYGEQFKEMIKRGTKVAFSLRAVGNVRKLQDGTMEVVAPMRVVTYDWVILPSHQCAYQQKIVSESAISCIEDSYRNEVMQESAIFEKINIGKVLSESKNVSEISKQLEFMYESITLSKDKTHAILKEKDGSATLYVKLEEYITNKINSQMASLIGEAKSFVIEENALITGINKVRCTEDRKNTILNYIEMNKGKSDYNYNEVGSVIELAARNRLFSTQDLEKYVKVNLKTLHKQDYYIDNLGDEYIASKKLVRDKKLVWLCADGFGNSYYYSMSTKHIFFFVHDNPYGKEFIDNGTLETCLLSNIDEFYEEIVIATGLGENTRSISIASNKVIGESVVGILKHDISESIIREYVNKNTIVSSNIDINEKSSAYDYFAKNIFHETQLLEFIANNENHFKKMTESFYKSIKENNNYTMMNYAELTAKNKEILIIGEMNCLGAITPVAVNCRGKLLKYNMVKNKDGEYIDSFKETTYEEWIQSDKKYIADHIKNRGV